MLYSDGPRRNSEWIRHHWSFISDYQCSNDADCACYIPQSKFQQRILDFIPDVIYLKVGQILLANSRNCLNFSVLALSSGQTFQVLYWTQQGNEQEQQGARVNYAPPTCRQTSMSQLMMWHVSLKGWGGGSCSLLVASSCKSGGCWPWPYRVSTCFAYKVSFHFLCLNVSFERHLFIVLFTSLACHKPHNDRLDSPVYFNCSNNVSLFEVTKGYVGWELFAKSRQESRKL